MKKFSGPSFWGGESVRSRPVVMSNRSASRFPKRYAFFTGSFVFAASDASSGTQPCPGAQNSAQQWYPGTVPSLSRMSGKPIDKRTGIPSERASAMNAQPAEIFLIARAHRQRQELRRVIRVSGENQVLQRSQPG